MWEQGVKGRVLDKGRSWLFEGLAGLVLLAFFWVYLPKAFNLPHELAETVETWVGGDLMFHGLVAFGVGMCGGHLIGAQRLSTDKFVLLSLAFLMLLIVDESIQIFLAFREASWSDGLANTMGWGISTLCWILLRKSPWPRITK